MTFLVDTHLLLWAFQEPGRLSQRARELLDNTQNQLFFSSVSIAEIAIKQALNRPHFVAESDRVRLALLASGYIELPFNGLHAVQIAKLPPVHKDPFDRMLVAQAITEAIPLLTMDVTLSEYPGPIWKV